LRVSTDALFISATNYNNIPTSEYTPVSPLSYNTQYWWQVITLDNTGLSSPASNVQTFWMWVLGDVDHSHSANIVDLTFLVDRLFRGGPAPEPQFVGDMNADCSVNILDLTYYVDRLFRSGPVPLVGCQN